MTNDNEIQTIDRTDLESFRSMYVQDAELLNTAMTFDEAFDALGQNEEDIAYIASPYRILSKDDKGELVGVPFLIRAWRFAIDNDTERPYVVAYCVTKSNDLVILTDGSTGIFEQLRALTTKRIGDGHQTPLEGALVANGLRVSEYGLNADDKPAKPGEKVVSKGRTFYLA